MFGTVAYAVIGISGVVSLALYTVLAARNEGRALHNMTRPPIALRDRFFLGTAAIAFLVCIYQGGVAMLGWMPSSWGTVGEYGEYRLLSETLAGFFAFGVGLGLIKVLLEAPDGWVELRLLAERNRELEFLLERAGTVDELDSAREHFARRQRELTRPSTLDLTWYGSPEGRREALYRELEAKATELRTRAVNRERRRPSG